MIYLDNAATTKPNENALRLAENYLREQFYNPSAMYREGYALQSELKKARSVLLSSVASETDFELVHCRHYGLQSLLGYSVPLQNVPT